MTTPTPRPLAEPRPLVEAWGVRDDEAGHLWHGTFQGSPQQVRDYAEAHEGLAGTVVPLIAADRLTDEALVEAVASRTMAHPWAVAATLAALRAHLESQ